MPANHRIKAAKARFCGLREPYLVLCIHFISSWDQKTRQDLVKEVLLFLLQAHRHLQVKEDRLQQLLTEQEKMSTHLQVSVLFESSASFFADQ